MNLKVGIVGLPNAGKSTLFNALLKKQVADAAPYPFCTIEPNKGIVPVSDGRLDALAKTLEKTEGVYPPLVPAVIEFVDIAGLVKGASEGQGLGNKFLSHIREVDLICHVLRYFPDPSVVHVAGDVDPARDREIIETELILADLQTLAKQIEPRNNATRDQQVRWQVITRLKTALDTGVLAKQVLELPEEIALIRDLQLLTMKPILYVANVSEAQLADQQKGPEPLLAICARTEMELMGLTPDEQDTYLASLGLAQSGLDRLSRLAYEMLGLCSFLTCGVKEARAWTIKNGTTAQEAAGVIHTDFSKKFIKADIVPFLSFVQEGGWHKARETGKVRQEGRDYIVRDGDVIEFKIGS